ncbi:MAG: ATP-dependent DNA helicase [Microbacterium sp.]|uniref:ATP-dependent DNA helicase n=1 Tax=Microbacterium sp. TaxID=51671 RepID=UPI001AD404E2|nr:ATP-dependent DNA helicase [Microbacterium sp.]MBN9214662.1 ATP-dependent DNA helicase [Microbacterium sp.]
MADLALLGTTTDTDLTTVPIGDDSALLTRAVRITTGLLDAKPREGQDALHRAIVAAMESRGHTAGQAPTGSGKSFAALSAAFLAAIRRGERTVISTDSLALMAQLQDKDVPIVVEAAAELYPDVSVQAAFMKGVANYIDPAKVIATAQALAGMPGDVRYSRLADALDKGKMLHGVDQFHGIEPDEFEPLRRLVSWACRMYYNDDPTEPGDRHACPVEHSPAMWATVSSPSSEADDGSRYGVTAKVTLARDAAAGADVVITNHSILAVQAAKAVPVIVGSMRLGHFEHIIVDEAHTLPSHVRSQGAAKLSGGVLTRIGRAVTRACSNTTASLNWRDAGEHLAEELDRVLREFAAAERDGLRRVKENDRPLSDTEELIKDWIAAGKKHLGKSDESHDVTTRLRASAAKDSLDNLKQTVEALTRHRTGWARWVEKDDRGDARGREWWGAHVSPIDVGYLLRDNLWSHTVTVDDVVETITLSVSGISATMPSNFPFQAGLSTQLVKYPSPFTAAYERSGLYIPRVASGPEFGQITTDGWGNKRRFDVRGHAQWATQQIIDLVRETGGRALILSATAREGKAYTEALRRALPRVKVHSQWDGGSSTRIVREWREDVGSVLVGTKTMMTGVDAPGETCSLVIIDRVPRSPGNPLDEARVEQINERIGNVSEAQRAVYAVDAALLLQQAVGRLIRTSSDVGLVAVLDPRLLKSMPTAPSPLAYPEPTRNTYMEAVRPFGRKMTDLDDAKAYIRRAL